MTFQNLEAWSKAYIHTHIDLGTGDGMYVLRLAREKPEWLVVGVDAAQDSLDKGLKKAAKKPARGGAPNAKFICANVLEMPIDLVEVADSLSINFPWGSLLTACAVPQNTNFPPFIKVLQTLLKGEGTLTVYLNAYVFEDEEMRRTLELPELTEDFVQSTLLPAYQQAGFICIEQKTYTPDAKLPVRTTWGGQLSRNSGRSSMMLMFQKKTVDNPVDN